MPPKRAPTYSPAARWRGRTPREAAETLMYRYLDNYRKSPPCQLTGASARTRPCTPDQLDSFFQETIQQEHINEFLKQNIGRVIDLIDQKITYLSTAGGGDDTAVQNLDGNKVTVLRQHVPILQTLLGSPRWHYRGEWISASGLYSLIPDLKSIEAAQDAETARSTAEYRETMLSKRMAKKGMDVAVGREPGPSDPSVGPRRDGGLQRSRRRKKLRKYIRSRVSSVSLSVNNRKGKRTQKKQKKKTQKSQKKKTQKKQKKKRKKNFSQCKRKWKI